MKEEIKNELDELGSSLGTLNRRMPFAVPAGYFADTGSRNVEAAMAAGEKTSLPVPVNPYQVPAGYFDQLPQIVADQITGKRKRGLLISFRQVSWAAAAVLVIMAGIGGYRMFSESVEQGNENTLLASVEDGEIQEYLGYAYQATTEVQKAGPIDKMDIPAADIVDYLDETGWDSEYY